MALTRARVVSGPPEFAARIEAAIRDVLCRKRDPPAIAATSSRCARRSPRKKAMPTRGTSNTRPAVSSISNSSRNICSSRRRRRDARSPRHLDGADAGKGIAAGRAQPEDAEVLRPAVRLFHDLTKSCGSACRRPSIPKPRAPASSAFGPRRRPARLSRARGSSRGNAASGARMFCPDFREGTP